MMVILDTREDRSERNDGHDVHLKRGKPSDVYQIANGAVIGNRTVRVTSSS
jgi:hypothetical protein